MAVKNCDWTLLRMNRNLLHTTLDWDLTGIIAANLTQPELNELAPLQIQIVNIVSSRPTVASLPRLCHIQMDFYKAGQMAAEYLCNLGFEQITTVSVHTEQMGTDTHSAGFRDVLAARGLLAEPLYVSENYPSIHQPETLREIASRLKTHLKPLALYCENDDIGRTLILLCRDQNIRVPEDVAILGRENLLLDCEGITPQLSSVELNHREAGFQAARVLDKMLRGQKVPEITRVEPTGVVPRQSTNILAIKNESIRNALSYIWEHYREKIEMDQLARSVGLSRRSMEYLFRDALQRSPYAEVLRLRFEKAKQLLCTTRFSLEEIAVRSGFNTAPHLSKMFKKHIGCSPSPYRESHTIHSEE